MSLLILVVDDEPDVEVLFRQQFRRDLRVGSLYHGICSIRPRRTSAHPRRGRGIPHLNPFRYQQPGMSGLELLPRAKAPTTRRTRHHDNGLWGRGYETQGTGEWRRGTSDKTHRLCNAA